ncbi:MAG: hypothetical protein DRI36_01150 [Caldiserica bacterium]|nr:MAG: hypothetical protein DRI36_01150 [Caldisericota bacterium]
MTQLKFIVAFFLIVVLVFLGVMSQPRVEFLGFKDIPLVVIVLFSAFVGSIISFIIGFPENLSLKKKISKLEKEIKEKETKITKLELEIRELEEKLKEKGEEV